MTAQPLGTILADVLEGLARDVRATAEASAGMKMAERGCALDAELPRQRQRELLAEEEDAGEWKGAGDLGAPAKLVGSEQFWLAIRSQLTGRFSAGMTTTAMRQAADIAQLRPRRAAASLMLVVDGKGGH
ncbi:hypothetical protein [Paradevosia shaoguanensis]|uniref:hypothetical protein n=1 Tax=Paradevosia shaoguanensis TaxID=1335043 RepID=UPI001931ECA2|nr:hypothetical protein [Paradevosia shaoguanensis]